MKSANSIRVSNKLFCSLISFIGQSIIPISTFNSIKNIELYHCSSSIMFIKGYESICTLGSLSSTKQLLTRKNSCLKPFSNFEAIGTSYRLSSSSASSASSNPFNNNEKRYISHSHLRSEQDGTPPKLHYDFYLKSNGKPTLEGLTDFIHKRMEKIFYGDTSSAIFNHENLEAKIFMCLPSPCNHEWKNFPYYNPTNQLLSIEEGVKFKWIEELDLHGFDDSEIDDGIVKEYNELSKELADANSADEIYNFLRLSRRDINCSSMAQPETERDIQYFYLSYVLSLVLEAINIVYGSNICVSLERYLAPGRKVPDIIIEDQKSRIFCITEIVKALPKAQIIKSMKSEDILNIQGVKKTIHSMVASNSNLGFLTSFGTTFIFEIDWDKSRSDSKDTCKVSLKMKVLDHNDPYHTVKATMMYFLSKLLIHTTKEEKHKVIKRSLKSRSNFIVKCKATQQKQCQLLRERFLIQYQNDHKDLDNSMIDVRLDSQVEKSIEQELTNMNKNVKYIKLKKRNFSTNGQFDNGNDGDDEVLLKWYEPITFTLNDDPIVNQEILEDLYLFEVKQMEKLEAKEKRNNVDLSQLRLWNTGFIRIRDENSNLVGIGNYIAMEIKKPKGNKEFTKSLPILTKSDILREAMNRLRSLHQCGIGLGDFAGYHESVIVNDGEVSILATRNFGDGVPDSIKKSDTEDLSEIIASGKIIEL